MLREEANKNINLRFKNTPFLIVCKNVYIKKRPSICVDYRLTFTLPFSIVTPIKKQKYSFPILIPVSTLLRFSYRLQMPPLQHPPFHFHFIACPPVQKTATKNRTAFYSTVLPYCHATLSLWGKIPLPPSDFHSDGNQSHQFRSRIQMFLFLPYRRTRKSQLAFL